MSTRFYADKTDRQTHRDRDRQTDRQIDREFMQMFLTYRTHKHIILSRPLYAIKLFACKYCHKQLG